MNLKHAVRIYVAVVYIRPCQNVYQTVSKCISDRVKMYIRPCQNVYQTVSKCISNCVIINQRALLVHYIGHFAAS